MIDDVQTWSISHQSGALADLFLLILIGLKKIVCVVNGCWIGWNGWKIDDYIKKKLQNQNVCWHNSSWVVEFTNVNWC